VAQSLPQGSMSMILKGFFPAIVGSKLEEWCFPVNPMGKRGGYAATRYVPAHANQNVPVQYT